MQQRGVVQGALGQSDTGQGEGHGGWRCREAAGRRRLRPGPWTMDRKSPVRRGRRVHSKEGSGEAWCRTRAWPEEGG